MFEKFSMQGSVSKTKSPEKAAAKPAPKIEPRHKQKQLPPFNVVLLNDDEHTYEYVVQLLRAVFGYSPEKGFQLAKAVDESQRAIVMTTHKELAELKREMIQSYGTDHRIASCKGSMSAVIEPA